MNNNERAISTNELFDCRYIDTKGMYIYTFGKVPSVTLAQQVDGERSFEAFKQINASRIREIHSYRVREGVSKQAEFDTTVVILNNNCLVEFDQYHCEILHTNEEVEFVQQLVFQFYPLKQKRRRIPMEINLVVRNNASLYLKSMEIKRTKLNLDLFYEDEFKKTDAIIRKRLNNSKDKGIVLLHGLPGTGKTTYLRYLVGKIKKRVLFLSPNIACNLVEPEFVELLINNPESVLVIEDAENIIMDRRTNSHSSVSNLLNISDGLLADFLNVQIICTFNSPLTMVDSALMRKGRLIAKYEFGKLGIEKSQRLSDHLGFDAVITKPMTLAEIANQHEADQQTKQVEAIGFKRAYLEN